MNALWPEKEQVAPFAVLLFLTCATGYWMQTSYLQSDLTFVAGLVVLCLCTVVRQPGVGSWRFAFWALLCVGLGLVIPARTFHFLALAFTAGFVFENIKGKINEAPVLTAFLLTAVMKTMSIVLGFAIRLELSKNAAAALRLLGMDAVAEGNIIHFKGQDFSVDPACMGLQMVEVSFLFCFFLLGLMERRSGKYLAWPVLLVVVAGVGILNLLFNQLRILFLVIFNILPENPMHDAVGLAGLVVYVFAPTWFGLQWAFRRTQHRVVATYASKSQNPPAKQVVQVLLGLCIGWFLITENTPDGPHVNNIGAIVPKGLPADCKSQILQDGVVQYRQDSLLIYVKPIRGFYSTEHTPLICWQGSGYKFGKVWEQKVGDKICYAGTLEKKDGPVLFTAWWFDNGEVQTVSQTRWRWLDVGGAPGFALINVTASNPQTLNRQLERMMDFD